MPNRVRSTIAHMVNIIMRVRVQSPLSGPVKPARHTQPMVPVDGQNALKPQAGGHSAWDMGMSKFHCVVVPSAE